MNAERLAALDAHLAPSAAGPGVILRNDLQES